MGDLKELDDLGIAYFENITPVGLAAIATECEKLRTERDSGGVVRELQAKLQTAEADITRLVAEREKLMEISNMLRADLNRWELVGGHRWLWVNVGVRAWASATCLPAFAFLPPCPPPLQRPFRNVRRAECRRRCRSSGA